MRRLAIDLELHKEVLRRAKMILVRDRSPEDVIDSLRYLSSEYAALNEAMAQFVARCEQRGIK